MCGVNVSEFYIDHFSSVVFPSSPNDRDGEDDERETGVKRRENERRRKT